MAVCELCLALTDTHTCVLFPAQYFVCDLDPGGEFFTV